MVGSPSPLGLGGTFLPQILLLMSGLLALRFGNGRVLAIAGLVWFGTHFSVSDSAPYALANVVLVGAGFFLVAALPERGPRSWSAMVMMLPTSLLGLVMFWPATLAQKSRCPAPSCQYTRLDDQRGGLLRCVWAVLVRKHSVAHEIAQEQRTR